MESTTVTVAVFTIEGSWSLRSLYVPTCVLLDFACVVISYVMASWSTAHGTE
jgi:hypothetical protein